jgi:hypothetical protein
MRWNRTPEIVKGVMWETVVTSNAFSELTILLFVASSLCFYSHLFDLSVQLHCFIRKALLDKIHHLDSNMQDRLNIENLTRRVTISRSFCRIRRADTALSFSMLLYEVTEDALDCEYLVD